MKILLLGFTKMKFMPYANFYLQNIDTQKNEVHLLYWNRDLQDEDLSRYGDIRLIEFRRYQEDSVPRIKKLRSFYAYRRFALKTIKAGNYDFIISLHTLPGLLVLDKLKKQFRKRYILDYRDSTFEEKNSVFAKMVKGLASNARLVFTSSDAYREYLPQDGSVEIITSHNVLTDSLQHRDYVKSSSDKIRIAFWGLLRHTALNKKIISALCNDARFELHYYGREQGTGSQLREHSRNIGATNVFFHGEYKPEERYDFAENTDLIHNIYLDTNTLRAMGNKYYDGIIFRIPQLCYPGSFMGKLISEKGLGTLANPDDPEFADKIFAYYRSYDRDAFRAACDEEVERVMVEYDRGKNMIKEILN